MTVYVEVKGTQIIQFPYTLGSLQAENPYTDFGPDPDIAAVFPQTQTAIDNGYTLAPVVYLPTPSYDPATQVAIQDSQPTLDNSTWEIGWTVRLMTPEEADAARNQVKAQASQLLSNTDWTSIPSVSDPAQSNPFLANQQAFLQYRNQVRAIAVNPPTYVSNWPVVPNEVWQTVA